MLYCSDSNEWVEKQFGQSVSLIHFKHTSLHFQSKCLFHCKILSTTHLYGNLTKPVVRAASWLSYDPLQMLHWACVDWGTQLKNKIDHKFTHILSTILLIKCTCMEIFLVKAVAPCWILAPYVSEVFPKSLWKWLLIYTFLQKLWPDINNY